MPGGRDTVVARRESWRSRIRPTLRPRTWTRYWELGRGHLIPAVGRLRLGRLQPAQLEARYAERLAAGSSPTTVHHVHRVLQRAPGAAVRQGRVTRNVTSLPTPPRMARTDTQVLSSDDVHRGWAAPTEDAEGGALPLLAVTTGMRQGELLALGWRDADMGRGTLAVTGTLQRVPDSGLV
ncbi:MAG TPA: site-specific integrase [Verrucomicrobiae bacterium]|nr:site-specific integrase [Verrucomicrobiae bacterium]